MGTNSIEGRQQDNWTFTPQTHCGHAGGYRQGRGATAPRAGERGGSDAAAAGSAGGGAGGALLRSCSARTGRCGTPRGYILPSDQPDFADGDASSSTR